MAGKKTGKRLLTWVLVLVMALSLLPVSALAADGTIVYGGVTLYTEKRPQRYTFLRSNGENAVTKNVGDTGFYQRLPRDTYVHTSCGTVLAEFIPDYYSASTTTVELSDPTVLKDLSWTISGWNGNDEYKDFPCLTFNFTAAKPGTTTVKLTFYYNYDHGGEIGYCNGCGGLVQYKANRYWWQETTTFTVTVTGEEEKPEYTLTYHENTTDPVTNMPDPKTVTLKSSTSPVTFTVSGNKPGREGYTFLGWAGNPNATEPTVQPGNTITTPATTTNLYAVWQSNTPPTDKPAKPTKYDVTGVVVDIVCVTTTGTHDMVQYPLGHPTDAQHTIGEVVSDGAGGYICPVTVRTAWFVQQASDLVWKVQHTPTASTITFNLTYDKNSETWVKPAANPRIEATHEVTPDTPDDTKPDFEKEDVNIRVQCTEWPSMHDPYKKNYGILPDAYKDLGMKKVEGTYFYTIELDRAKYIAQFDKDIGKPHTDTEPNEKTYIEWRWENGAWHLIGGPDGVDADIKVKCGQTETPPAAPTADELKELEMAVQVKCVVDDSQQHKEAYGLLGKCDADYFVGEPRKDGDDWLCDINYVPDLYVAKFNTTFQNLKHVQNDEKIVPVTLIWDGENWQIKTQGSVHVTEEYTVTFNSYGGTPVPPAQEVEYGLTATEPTTAPTKTGYTFDGWYLGDEKYDFSDAVEQNITLRAKWEAKQVVNVVIYRNGNFETPYKTVELDKQSKGTVIDLGKLNIRDYYTPNATGKYEFYGWYNDGAWNNYKKDPANAPDGLNSVTVNGWTNIIAMVYDYEKVAVKAVYDNDKTGAKDIFVGEALHGSPLKAYLESNNIALDQPGYTHTEWYNWDWYAWEDHAVGANAKVNGWTNVYVAYKAIPYGVTYSYHNSVPAEVMDTLPTDKGTYTVKDQVPVQIPTAKEVAVDGYKWTFKGWQLDGKDVKSEKVNMTVGGLHFKGIWECEALPAAEYPVTYEYVSGTEGAALPWNVFVPVNKYTYAEGEKVTTAMKPDDVVFGEYTWKFQGWTLNGTAVAPNTQVPMAKGGLHFVGTWIRTSAQDEEYPVTYSYVSGVEGVELPEEVKATLPVNKDTYTIGQQVPTAAKPANVTVGDYIWSLKAWKLGDNEIVPNNSVPMVEGGLNFVGIWTREKATVTVTFDANGGTVAPTSKTITKGSTLTLPTPVLSGYSFDGWFTEKTGGTQVNAGATFDKDTTLYAHWTKKSSSGGGGSSSRDYDYTLRYVTNGGKSIASETKSKRWTKDYEDLPMPTRAGYRFDGWYYDSALKNEVTGDVKVNSRTVTLYAGWIGSSVPDSLNGEDHFAYVQGYADGTVRPNTPVTRAQVATILFRLLDESVRKEYLTENNTFTDVASNYWANTAISTMANMGVFKGRTADRFDPNAPITRGEFAAVCARFDDSKVKTTETYSDIDGYWAANEILRAAALGWVQGYQDGSYRPNNSITRAQVVTMINRVLCRMPERNADLLKGMSSFTDCAEDDWCYLAIQEATNSHDYKTKSGSIHEKWTDLNTAPDWSRFEH